jgi:endoglucanase
VKRVVAASALCVALLGAAASSAVPSAAAGLSVTVSGNHLVDGAGQPLRLLGVDRSGTEYACVQWGGIFDGPSSDASVAAMAAWHVNAVRVPMNEDCWLGINGAPVSGLTAAQYQQAIAQYVQLLHNHGLYAILDLHWNAPGGSLANGQQAMVDADHGPAFWASVASAFKGDPAVIFDLYNEPEFISWSCWLSGAGCPVSWPVAGMQSLVTAVRGSGATQPIMLGGVAYANDLSQWLANEPSDPQAALVASFHVYNFNTCHTIACWDSQVAPVAAQVPVVAGEIGEDDGGHSFIDGVMGWADAKGISYLAWTWDTWGCGNAPVLISDYAGTPCQTFGAGYQAHLAQFVLPTASLASGPGVASWGPGRLDVFVRGSDNALWHRYYASAIGWSGWTSLGGQLASDPAAVSWGYGRLDIFAQGNDNALHHIYYDASAGGWSGWYSHGGVLASGPDVTSWGSGRLDVFYRAADNTLGHIFYASSIGAWSSESRHGGNLASDPAAVSWGFGRIDVVARASDNSVSHLDYDASKGGWSGWSSIGGTVTSGPAMSSWGSGRLDVFARGSDNALWHAYFAGTWSGWTSLGNQLTSDPGAVSWGGGRIDVFAAGSPSTLLHRYYDSAGGGWSGWVSDAF